jgi:transglutaminase-like putative cysteine protease
MRTGSLRMPVFAALATLTAAICLGPAFLTGIWFFPTAFAVLVVGVGCEVARRTAASRATVPFGGLAALAIYLLLRYAHDQALFGVIPWTDSFDHVGNLASAGKADINRYTAPIGVSPGIELLTVGGVGLVAVAVDTLAVTFRHAALAGLPLLVLYTVPTAVAPDGVSWVAFALAGIAYLALLLAESRERVSRWGRPMRYSVARTNFVPEADTAPLSQVGRRVGATALGLALVVPALLPNVSASAFGFGGGAFGHGGGGGSNKVSVINPFLQLGENLRQGDNTTVIRYTGKATYLRLVGDDQFTGDVWKPRNLTVSRDNNDVEKGLSTPPGLGASVSTTKRHYRIDVFDLEEQWLPLPYPAKRVSNIDGTWLYDSSTFNVFGENSSTRQISYQVTALSVNPTPQQLATSSAAEPASVRRYLDLPRNMDPTIEGTADDVTKGLTTNYDKALAIQNYLRDPTLFTYSQTVDATVGDSGSAAAIASFLQNRRGYCVQFASTMAVMARILKIPSRVAVGFAAGASDGKGHHLVGLHDAHAWPELYFPGVGWVPFEPTPGGPASSPPSYANQQPGAGAQPTSSSTSSPGQDRPAGASDPSQNPRTPQGPLANDGSKSGAGKVGAGPVQLPIIPTLIVLVTLVLLAVPGLTRLAVRRRRWRRTPTASAQALAAWTDLQDTLVDFHYDWDPADPPRRGAARLAADRHLVGEGQQALGRIASATERARYAPEMSPVGDLRADVGTVRAALADGSSRWGRWRARLFPRSTRAVAAGISNLFADGLDAVDNLVTVVTTRRRLRRT